MVYAVIPAYLWSICAHQAPAQKSLPGLAYNIQDAPRRLVTKDLGSELSPVLCDSVASRAQISHMTLASRSVPWPWFPRL